MVPPLELAFIATISVSEVQEIGITPRDKRRIISITGGTFDGPVLKGPVESDGADWQLIRDGNVVELEARYTLRTDDGNLIYVKNRGYRHGPAEVLQRLLTGQGVDPKEYYFPTAPVFETAFEKYDYFNRYIYKKKTT